MRNKEIRTALFINEIKQCELADAIGCHEQTLSRKLRYELPDDEREKIMNIIKKIVEERS